MGYCCRFAASAAASATAAFNLFRVLWVMVQTWNFAPRSSILSYITAQSFVWFRPLGPKLWGKFPKTIEFTFKFYHSAFSSNGMILKFCTVFLYGSEGCVRKFRAISFIFARITGKKGFFKVRLSLWTIKKQNFQISLLGSRSLNNNRTHFIFGIIDVNNDTEQLAKKFLNFVHYSPNNREKGTKCTLGLSLWTQILTCKIRFQATDHLIFTQRFSYLAS